MSIAQDELFGPVTSIIEVRGEEQALQVANATLYGLSSAVITGATPSAGSASRSDSRRA